MNMEKFLLIIKGRMRSRFSHENLSILKARIQLGLILASPGYTAWLLSPHPQKPIFHRLDHIGYASFLSLRFFFFLVVIQTVLSLLISPIEQFEG